MIDQLRRSARMTGVRGVALAKVPYEKWVKWYAPLFGIFLGLVIQGRRMATDVEPR